MIPKSKSTKSLKIISLIFIIICILLVFILKNRFEEYNGSGTGVSEGFYNFSNKLENLSNIAGGPQLHYDMYPGSVGSNGSNNYQGSIYYGPGPNYPDNTITDLYQQPLMFSTQSYPKIPWYPKAGMSCSTDECGATATCIDKKCVPNSTDKTVLDTPII
jgi:hypothetical protein